MGYLLSTKRSCKSVVPRRASNEERSTRMNWTGCSQRVLQVHPSRRCNLQCLHCYSSSSPHESGDLESDLLAAAIDVASSEGYNVISFSGGEPFLYPALPQLLKHAKH